MMETMEKSKSKKKKKTKPIAMSSSNEETEDIADILDNLPSTSDLESLFYQECIVSQADCETIEEKPSDLKNSETTGIMTDEVTTTEITENIEIANTSYTVEISNNESNAIVEKTMQKEVNELTLTPSAPNIMDTNEVAQRMDFYPNLHKEQSNLEHFNYHTQKSCQKETETPYNILRNEIKVELDIQPFTKEQFTELYMNPLLTQVDHFEKEFIDTELNNEASYSNHILYTLLLNYAKSRNHMRTNLIDYENYKKLCINNEKILWTLENHKVTFEGSCYANKSTKKIVENFDYAVYNNNAANNLALNLKDLTNTVYYSYTQNSFASEVNKLEIDEKIKEIINHKEFINLQSASSISLETNIDENLQKPIGELRISISILFFFLRQSLSDKVLCNDIKLWLEKLIATHIRVATWQDHFFLLFHILRCPAGIGTWASQALQISNEDNKFSLKEINHSMAIITKLLLPVTKRDDFLKPNTIDALYIPSTHANSSNTKDENWILVDSDGEDGHNSSGECVPLKESDLVALLNQIPLEKIFNYYTMTEYKNKDYICKRDNITGYNLLTFIAFSTNLIEILSNGLETYKSERYKQFAKRLGRLIAHTVQYISDMHELFKKNDAPKDLFLSARIQLEFDIFVMRASNCIYKSRCFGTWQYLTVLPFGSVTVKTLWKLFYFLHVGYDDVIETLNDDCIDKILDKPRFYAKFSDLCTELPAEDLYYLLQTFVNMIVVKETNDHNFIRTVAIDLVIIGYINKTTKDICYKTTRDLLVNLMTKYPHLLLDILNIVNEQGEHIDPIIIYLYKSLPISLWIPTNNNFEIIATWLINFSYESTQNTIARIILNKLNWNFDENGKLFLPYEIHVRIACLIVKIANKHVPECIGTPGSVSMFVKDQSSKTQFSTWCWNMMSILRLHCMDQSKEVVYNTIQHPFEILKHIAEIEQLESIFEGVVESRPIALFASILASQWGHSIPQICHKGFIQLQQLLLDSRHSTVIRCIHLLTPLFLNCPESLSCEKFNSILTQLLSADRTYMKIAKEFISSDSYGPVVEMFANMIQAQITDYISYGFSSPTPFIKMWLLCLTNNNNWYKDTNVLHIIDVILRIAYLFPDSWMAARTHFHEIYQKLQASKITKSSFINFLGSSAYNEIVTFPSTNTYWLSFLTLDIEYEIVEIKLWPEILRQIGNDTKQTSLDNIIKKAAVLIGCPAYSADSLTLYKWANLIISCPNNHQLLPIMAQRFFVLYLGRIPYNIDELRFVTTFGGADKFYETNIKLMKKLKKRLIDAKDFYWKLVLKDPETIESLINRNCSDFFNSCVLWLEETILSKIKGDMIELPVSYNIAKLQLIFTGNKDDWNEYLNLPELIRVHKDASKIWLKSCFRYYCTNQLNSSALKEAEDDYDPEEKIFQHLKSYDKPLAPWKVSHDMAFVEPLPVNLNSNVIKILRNNLKTVSEQAKNFNLKINEINALDCNYKDLTACIYKTETITRKRKICMCTSCDSNFVEKLITRSFEDKKIRSKIMTNREKYFEEIKKQLNKPSSNIVLSIVKIQSTIRLLKNEYINAKESNNEQRFSIVSQLGVAYFYDLFNVINEQISIYPPSKELCYSLISELGMFFEEKQCTEGLNLIKAALKKPKLVNILTELFVPTNTSPKYFLEMYHFIVLSNTNDQNSEILFVLLYKFDINKWLTAFNPKLKEINQLINIILNGLEGWTNKKTQSIQKIFRQHLIELFEYKFPEHCGEILQLVLSCTSDQKIDPNILLDVINSMYEMANCEKINMKMSPTRLNEEFKNFAMKQKLFTYNDLVEVAALLTRHYQNERLQHGLHGLYPKHKQYCDVISLLYGSMTHAIIVSAVHAYPGVLAEQLIEWLWPILRDLFASWLVPYYMQNMESAPATWIQQLSSNNPVLLPWTELYTNEAQIFLNIFYDSIVLLLDMLPGCDTILANIFFWYESVYANNIIPRYIHTSIHNTLMSLPWNRFRPTPAHIDCINKIVQQFIPDSHMFIGHIFQRIPWTPWLQQNVHTWDYNLRMRTLTALLHIIVKLSYEPNIREGTSMNTILQEAKSYPWHIIEYQGVQSILDWFVMSSEPSTILKMPSEHLIIDNALIEFLEVVCAFSVTIHPDILSTPEAQTKRILFVRSMVRLLRSCGSKHQQLLDTKEGKQAFYNAITNLLNSCSQIVKKIKIVEEAKHESINLVIELISSIEVQSEYTSLLMAQSIIKWQSNCDIGCFILISFINSFGVCKHVSNNLCLIMEATIFNYFKTNEALNDYHKPSWQDVINRLGLIFPSYDTHFLIHNNYILTLHMLSMHKLMTKITSYGEKLTFLNSLLGFIVHCKTGEAEEPKIALIWALIICNLEFNNCSIATNDFILILINYFNDISNETESWGGSILGAIGLKKEKISNKRKILAKILNCFLLSHIQADSFHASISESNNLVESSRRKYYETIGEIKASINTKKLSDIRASGEQSIKIIESSDNIINNIRKNVYKIIRLFYSDHFLVSLE